MDIEHVIQAYWGKCGDIFRSVGIEVLLCVVYGHAALDMSIVLSIGLFGLVHCKDASDIL